MPITIVPFRLGVNQLSGDVLFGTHHTQGGVVIPKTVQDNAVIPPAPDVTPSPWNLYFAGTTTINDYRLHARWAPRRGGGLPHHDTTLQRWRFGKNGDTNPGFQSIHTTYPVLPALEHQSSASFKVHESPFDDPDVPATCAIFSTNEYPLSHILQQFDPNTMELQYTYAGLWRHNNGNIPLPAVVMWMYHLTSGSPIHSDNSQNQHTDFSPSAPRLSCESPVYYLYRGMGFLMDTTEWVSPVFINEGSFEIQRNDTIYEGRFRNTAGYTVAAFAAALSAGELCWGIEHRRIGLWSNHPQIENVEWTITGPLTPWMHYWNIKSSMSNWSWSVQHSHTSLHPAHHHWVEIQTHPHLSTPEYRFLSNNTWSGWYPMTLSGSVWKTMTLTQITALEWRAPAAYAPIEMVSGSLFVQSPDPPPSGTDLTIQWDVRMPIVALCRNLARITLTRVSGEGVAKITLTSPQGTVLDYLYNHTQLPVELVLPITEAGDWRVQIYDRDGTYLRYDRYYRVRRGDARDIDAGVYRKAFGLVGCRDIQGAPDHYGALDNEFAIESGIDELKHGKVI